MLETTLPRRTQSAVYKYVETMVCGNLWTCQEVDTEIIWMDMPIATTATTQQCMDAYMHARTGVYTSSRLVEEVTCGRQLLVSVGKLPDIT